MVVLKSNSDPLRRMTYAVDNYTSLAGIDRPAFLWSTILKLLLLVAHSLDLIFVYPLVFCCFSINVKRRNLEKNTAEKRQHYLYCQVELKILPE